MKRSQNNALSHHSRTAGRILSALLSLVMLVQLVPAAVFAAEPDEVIPLVFQDPQDSENKFSFACVSSDMDEGHTYSFTVTRSGDAAEAAAVELRTVDISAVYGKDYTVRVDGADTQLLKTGGTVLEQSADAEEQSARKALYEQTAAEDETGESAQTDAADGAEPEDAGESQPSDSDAGGQKSLAQLKEEQTGLPTRQLSQTETQSLRDVITQQYVNSLGGGMEPSSKTALSFAAGETEKTVVVRIPDDSQSEGSELFQCILTSPDEGYDIGSGAVVQFTIVDDEPAVRSKLSFTAGTFYADGDSVTVTIARDDALYSLATAGVRSVGTGSAAPGENYASTDEALSFTPYDGEVALTIPVSAGGSETSFDLELYDLKGCEAGETVRCTVVIPQAQSAPAQMSLAASASALTAAADPLNFSITIDNTSYDVVHDGTFTGSIVDAADVTVGTYFYMLSNGGFNHFEGSNPGIFGNRESKFLTSDNADDDTERALISQAKRGVGYLYYYNAKVKQKGLSTCYLPGNVPAFNSLKYQYAMADLYYRCDFSSKHAAGGFDIRVPYNAETVQLKKNVCKLTTANMDQRMLTPKVAMVNSDNLPVAQNYEFKFWAGDQADGGTPKTELYIYGAVAMYRKFNIVLQQPDSLTYYTYNADGTATAQSRLPAQVQLGEGHKTRYAGQDLQLVVTSTAADGPIEGVLTGYQITVGTGDTAQTFSYTPKGSNIQDIPFDDDFIRLLNTYSTGEALSSDNSYTTTLKIKPIFTYKNVTVDVGASKHGAFSALTVGTGKTFHKGDVLSLASQPQNGYYSDGCRVQGYVNASDTQPELDGNQFTASLKLTDEKYVLSPNFTEQNNHITVRMTLAAQLRLRLQGMCNDELLPPVVRGLSGDFVLRMADGKSEEAHGSCYGQSAYTPVYGQVYQISALPKYDAASGKIYRPVFTVLRTGQKVNGYTLDMVAQNRAADNIILVDVEEVSTDDLLTFALSGVVRTSGNSVRDSATAVAGMPAMNVNVTAGATVSKLYDTAHRKPMTSVSRYSAQTDMDGNYSVKGIRGLDGDTISVEIRNGDVTSVEYVQLSKAASTAGTISYYDETGSDEEEGAAGQPISVEGYLQTVAPFTLPVRSPLAPYVTRVEYAVDSSGIADPLVDTRNNEIAIQSKFLTVKVWLERNNRDVKEAIFSCISPITGTAQEFHVPVASGQSYIEYRFTKSMADMFQRGDMLYVRLVDAEDQVVETRLTDSDGNETVTTTSYAREYADLFTGLTFYVPTIYPQPQYYNIDMSAGTDSDAISVPMLGEIGAKVSSGSLSWSKTLTSSEQNAPYYLSFYFTPTVSNQDTLTACSILSKVDGIADQTAAAAASKYSGDVNLEQAHATMAAAAKDYDSMSTEVKQFIDDVRRQDTDLRDQGKTQDELIAAYDDSLKSNKELIKAADKDYKEATSQRSYAKSATKLSGGKASLTIQVLFQMFYAYNTEKNEYQVVSTQYFLGGSTMLSYLQYWTVYGVPIYLKITGTMAIQISGNSVADTSKATLSAADVSSVENLSSIIKPNTDTLVYASLQAMVGAGIMGVLSARGVVTFGVNGRTLYTENPDPKATKKFIQQDGFLVSLSGGIGLDLFLFSFNYTLVTATYGSGLYQGQTGVTAFGGRTAGQTLVMQEADVGESDLGTFGQASFSGGEDGYQVLLDNAAARAKPQLIQLSDSQQMIVFVDRDTSRADSNQMCLYYSIGTNGRWSAPAMLDDNGTADADPHVYVHGGKCLISWSDANMVFSEATTPAEKLNSLELAYRVYDIDTGVMGEKVLLTDDSFMDNNAKFALTLNGDVFCYYIKRQLTSSNAGALTDVSATYSTVAFRSRDEDGTLSKERLLPILCEGVTDPLILDFDSEVRTFNGDRFSLMTYTVDFDGNLQTASDRDVYLMITNLTREKAFYPIRITHDSKADVSPQLTVLGSGEEEQLLLTWVSDDTDLCTINLTGAVREIKESGAWDSILAAAQSSADTNSNPDWYKLSESDAAKLGIDAENYHNSIFERLYTGHLAPDTKRFTKGDQAYNLGSCKLYNNGGVLYLLWTETGGEDGVGQQELYGAVLDTAGNQASWGEPVQLTAFGRSIDEFSASFDSDQTMYLTANIFDQKIGEDGQVEYSPNQILFYEYPRADELTLGENISFDGTPRAGAESDFTLELTNSGLKHLDAYHVKVEAIQSNTARTIWEQDFTETLRSGETVCMPVSWTPAATEDAALRVTLSAEGCGTVTRTYAVPQESNVVIASASAAYVSGAPQAVVELFNQGNLSSGKLTLSAANSGDTKSLGSSAVSSLAPGEHRTVTLPLNELHYSDLDQTGSAMVNLSLEGENLSTGAMTMLSQSKAAAVVFDGGQTLSMTVGGTAAARASVMPANVVRQDISYVSSNPAAVSVSQDGTLTANRAGSAAITAFDAVSGLSASVTVRVRGNSEDLAPAGTTEPGITKTTDPATGAVTTTQTRSDGVTVKTVTTLAGATTADVSLPAGSGPVTVTIPTLTTPADGVVAVIVHADGTEEVVKNSLPTEGGLTVTLKQSAKIKLVNNAKTFSDVPDSFWARDAVDFVSARGIFGGTSASAFSPDTGMTRGMLAKVLHNLEGSPAPASTGSFTDVPAGSWCADAVYWAAEKGIVTGYGDGTFRPNDRVTRQQLAAMLYRYEQSKGGGFTGQWSFRLDYTDAGQVREYAYEPLCWMTMKGVINGVSNHLLSPNGTATRAQVAAMLMRYCKLSGT